MVLSFVSISGKKYWTTNKETRQRKKIEIGKKFVVTCTHWKKMPTLVELVKVKQSKTNIDLHIQNKMILESSFQNHKYPNFWCWYVIYNSFKQFDWYWQAFLSWYDYYTIQYINSYSCQPWPRYIVVASRCYPSIWTYR